MGRDDDITDHQPVVWGWAKTHFCLEPAMGLRLLCRVVFCLLGAGESGELATLFLDRGYKTLPHQLLNNLLFHLFDPSFIGLMDAGVTQKQKYLVKKVGEKVLIECSQNMGHDRMFWYRQDPGLGLRLLHFSYGIGGKEKGDFPDGYSVSREKKEEFPLTLESASTNQTSVYLCASSESTALHGHILSAQKGPVEGSEPDSGLSYSLAPTAQPPVAV